MRSLSLGSEGNDVRTLQHFLRGRALYFAEVDGAFGPKTETAVKIYQRQEGLVIDGHVGRLTLAAMIRDGLPVLTDAAKDIPLPPAGMTLLTKNEDRQRHWGRIQYVDDPTPDNPEAIRITNGFEEEHIVAVDCPIWAAKKVRLHRRVVDSYLQFMQAILEAGLQSRLITFDGGFVARYIRGSRTSLSNHSWGTAFEVNADSNPLGRTPPFIGEHGSVREIVELGATFGWYWGGWFKRRDGMHFEHI